MPATIDPDAHKFSYVNGTNAATRLAGYGDGGAAWIHPDHWLALVGKDWLPAAVGGQIAISGHKIEWLFMEALIFKDSVMALGQGWSLGLPLISQLQAELCYMKIPQNAMGEKETREFIKDFAKANLTVAQRTVTVAHLVQDPCTSADWHAVATNKLVAGSMGSEGPNQDLSHLRHFRMLLAGGYNSADQASARFVGLVDLVDVRIHVDSGMNRLFITNEPRARLEASGLPY